MKRFSMNALFAVALLFLLLTLTPLRAYADTVALTLISASGPKVGSDYTYPYHFSVNGSMSTTRLLFATGLLCTLALAYEKRRAEPIKVRHE